MQEGAGGEPKVQEPESLVGAWEDAAGQQATLRTDGVTPGANQG